MPRPSNLADPTPYRSMPDLDGVAGRLLGRKLKKKIEEMGGEAGYDLLLERLVTAFGDSPVGKGLSHGMRRQLARVALESLGLDQLRQEDFES